MNQPAKKLDWTMSWSLVYACAAAGEGQVLYLALQGIDLLPEAIFMHCAVTVALTCWLLVLRKQEHDKRAASLILVSTAALGPVGYAGASVSILAWRLTAKTSARKLDAYYSSLFNNTESAAQELYKNLSCGRERPGQYISAATIIDVLRWGTIEEKYKALGNLARSFRPELAASLRFALTSPEPTVRIQAASMVAKIEKQYTQRWMDLNDRVRRDPENAELRLELAQHLDNYAHTGMLDQQREQEVRQQAAELFRHVINAHADARDARLALGRLLTRLGEHESALVCLAPLLDDPRAVSWYCQSLYGLGRFDEIRELANRNDCDIRVSPQADRVAGMRQLWSGISQFPALASPRGELS